MREEFQNKIKKIFESKKVLMVASIVGVFIIACLIFQAGVFVGFHKASFDRDWGKNYEQNFGMMGGNRGPLGGGIINRENFPNAHGSAGKIIKIELPTIIVQDKDGTEKVVLINDNTSIRSMMNDITKNDLKIDDFAVVIGSPNTQGQIEAKLIRLMPAGLPNFPPNNPIPQN